MAMTMAMHFLHPLILAPRPLRPAPTLILAHRSSSLSHPPPIPTLPNLGSIASLSAAMAVLLSTQQPLAATTIKMGADEGTLVFVPASVSIAAGEKVTFINNKGFPHNVVFEKDGVPENVQSEKISHLDYMNEQGEQYVVLLTEKGTYKFFCEPHQSAGMYGEIIVN